MKPSAFLNRAVFFLLACLLSCSTQAAQTLVNHWQDCGAPFEVSTIDPFYINVGQDAQVGDPIGQTRIVQQAGWNCTLRSSAGPVGHKEAWLNVFLPNVAGVWGTTILRGQNSTVFSRYVQAGGVTKQIGFILHVELSRENASSNDPHLHLTYPLNNPTTGFPFQIGYEVNPVPNNTPVYYRAIISMQMVKISNDFPTTNTIIAPGLILLQLKTKNIKNIVWHDPPTAGGQVFTGGTEAWDYSALASAKPQVSVLTTNASCISPSGVVDLGLHSINSLPNITPYNSVFDTVAVPTQFNNCPQHMHNVVYKFSPVPAYASINNGVLPLIAPSTATGVGVQVFEYQLGGITPLDFNKTHTIHFFTTPADNHMPTSAISNLVLRARMVRLHPGISPGAGTVHAAMKVVASYK